jgi:hypothetical protein
MAYNAKRDAFLAAHEIAPASNLCTGPLSAVYSLGYKAWFLKGSDYLRLDHIQASSPPPEFRDEQAEAAWSVGFRDGAEAATDLHLDWLIDS